MIRLYAGYLDRFTFNGTRNINETMTYYRTERGTRFLSQSGYPIFRGTKDQSHHQALLDISTASIELGVKAHPHVELLKWSQMLEHPLMPDSTKTDSQSQDQAIRRDVTVRVSCARWIDEQQDS